MEDFILNDHEKSICGKCDFDYLESDFCKDCYIDTCVVNKSHTWFEHDEFKNFSVYEGINLGELIDYDIRRLLFAAMSKIEKEIK